MEIGIEENTPHKVSEVICIDCKHRWIAIRPTDTLLKGLECPQCRQQGYVIETGEVTMEKKEAVLVEQNAILQELKTLHLRMEHQTICNDAGGNRMCRRAWRHVNEAINIIQEDKEVFKW